MSSAPVRLKHRWRTMRLARLLQSLSPPWRWDEWARPKRSPRPRYSWPPMTPPSLQASNYLSTAVGHRSDRGIDVILFEAREHRGCARGFWILGPCAIRVLI